MPCSDTSWSNLCHEYNRLTTDVIRVPRDDLEAVCACQMERDDAFKPSSLVARTPRTGSTTVEVRRDLLFTLLKAHGQFRCDNRL